MTRRYRPRRLLFFGAIAAIGLVGTATAAANTVPPGGAGDGSAPIPDYAVVPNSVQYTMNSTNPQALNQVRFQASPAPVAGSTFRIKLNNSATWYSCTFSGANVTCNTTSPQALMVVGGVAATSFRVIGVD